ncbi:MAG: response regulator transcription factor [Saprospiraceae bacterium]|nr:response regulator transcription factor [Saprospiraceae bacterium]
MNPIKVAIIEDNYLLREGLTQLLNGTPGFKCVGAFSDASDILFRIKRAAPDVILMDIDIPGKMNGLEATFCIKQAIPKCTSLCRPYLKTKQKIFQAIKSGASGYLIKNTPPAKLLEAIQDVVAGGSPMSPTIAYKALKCLEMQR